jgi:hypothetical protein
VKVSVGEFKMKLGDANVKIVDEGIVASYKIDKISFSAFKLRFRPDVFDLAEPCHFSGRVEMGGEANDVVVELRYNPVVDIEKCRIGEPGHVYVHVDVGKIHLAPLPNGVDDVTNCFKDMVVDAVNACLYYAQESQADVFPMILNQIVQTTDDVLEVDCPFTHTETGKTAIAAVKSAGAPITAAPSPGGATTTAPAPVGGAGAGAGGSAAKGFAIKPIPNARGRLGHLNLKMPAGSKDSKYVICKAGDKDRKALKEGYGGADETLIPGTYDVYISSKLVPAVEVQPTSETTLAIGAIKLNAGKDTKYAVLDADGKTSLQSGYGSAVIALPAGNYSVEISGSSAPVEVKAGEVTEF